MWSEIKSFIEDKLLCTSSALMTPDGLEKSLIFLSATEMNSFEGSTFSNLPASQECHNTAGKQNIIACRKSTNATH